jgi:hypothetical protein
MNQQSDTNNCYLPWPGQPTTNPYNSPGYYPVNQTDPNASLAVAIHRLAAALEKLASK